MHYKMCTSPVKKTVSGVRGTAQLLQLGRCLQTIVSEPACPKTSLYILYRERERYMLFFLFFPFMHDTKKKRIQIFFTPEGTSV